ncbi:MAG TPA: hypothetical protein VJ770_09545, partial [Stellaceae bacterium]|nr:hypothetical protein [Stellaceae bacterium]
MADIPLGAADSGPESGTVAESLSEIREILHELEESTPATESVPAADAPRGAEPDAAAGGAAAV